MDSLILATDINRHKLYLSELDHKLKMNAFDVSRASDRQLFLEVHTYTIHTYIRTYILSWIYVFGSAVVGLSLCVCRYLRTWCLYVHA